MALIRLTQVNGRFIRETPSSRHRTQRCPTTPEPPPHVPPTQAKQPSRRALHRISNFTSAPPPFAAIPARPFLAPFAADPPDLRPTTPRSESLARNRATLRYVRELRPARPIVRPRNSRATDGFWRVLRADALFVPIDSTRFRTQSFSRAAFQQVGIFVIAFWHICTDDPPHLFR